MALLSHWQLPVFRELRLEDSYVLGIRECAARSGSGAELRFDMEFVLGERHPSYRRPESGSGGDQDACYRKGRLVFRDVTDLAWADKRTPETPAEGDLGRIESFVFDGAVYKLRGAWGKVELRAGDVQVDVW